MKTILCSLSLLLPLACSEVDSLDFKKEDLSESNSGGTKNTAAGGEGNEVKSSSGGDFSEGGAGPDGGPIDIPEGPAVIEGAVRVHSEGDVRAVASFDGALYWIDYGSYDDLGNYKFDGKLWKTPHGKRKPTVVAHDLHGPIELRVGSAGAFVYVEESTLTSPDARAEVWQIGLELGDFLPIATADAQYGFRNRIAFNTAFGFVAPKVEGKLYSQGLDDNAQAFLEDLSVYSLAASDTHLFYSGEDGTFKVDLDEQGDAEKLSKEDFGELALHGDRLIGAEDVPDHSYLTALPTDGSSTWTRIVELPRIENVWQLEIVGDRYYAHGYPGNVVTGTFDDEDSSQTVIALPSGSIDGVWTASPVGLYYLADDGSIMHLSLEAIDELARY